MSQIKRIFIVGHPGAGKALLAKTVAEKLGWQFIDADLGLEAHVGCHITEILGKQGKEAFLNCQFKILNSLMSKDYIVVTTDTNIVLGKKNRQLLSAEFAVYLKVSIPVQTLRLARQAEPLLEAGNHKDFLNKLHLERDKYYEQVSGLIVNSDNSQLDKHVANVINKIQPKQKSVISLTKKDTILFHKKLHQPVQLSMSQAKCLKLLSQGKSSKEIARILSISFRTVEGCIAMMAKELGCTTSKQLIALYLSQP